MLSFDIGSLQSHAAAVDGELAPNDDIWEDGDPRPATPIRVVGRLSTAGAGRYYFSGRIEGTLVAECRRCLTDVESKVAAESHLIFAESDLAESDEADVFVIPPNARTLDLRAGVREEWLLAAPAFPLCREDCRGLCAQCGTDLNDAACECAPAADPRWQALTDRSL